MRAPAPAPAIAGWAPVSVPASMGPLSDPLVPVPGLSQQRPLGPGRQGAAAAPAIMTAEHAPTSGPMGSVVGTSQLLALGPGPSTGVARTARTAGIESAQAAADAVPPVVNSQSGQQGFLLDFKLFVTVVKIASCS